MTQQQNPERVCVLPGDPSWLVDTAHLEQVFALLGRAAEVAEDEGEADRYLLPALTFRIAQRVISRIKDDVLDPDAGKTAVVLVVVPAFELDALWAVLEALRRTRDGDPDAAELLEVLDLISFDGGSSPSRTPATYTADLETVLAVLALDIPAVRDMARAFALDRAPGFDFDVAYGQLTTAWHAAGIKP
ncbi:hypothetical protein [Streptomyces sp. NPDC006638]|uniref:hypothetical protein n=1 Tax=Streptomyces sp. NPDC006638 TaxID=3157183 RepID=UPI00339FE308